MPRLDRLWYVIDAETKGFDEGVMKSGEKLRSFTDYAKGNPLVVLGALGAASVAAGYAMAQMAMDFEKQMRMVQTVTVEVGGTMDDLRVGVLRTFSELPIGSLEEMTKGLYDIISSGIPAGDAIAYLDVAAKAAVGGVTSVAVAVDALTSATNAWKASGLTATDASDQMFQAVNKGKMTFEQLAGSMGTVSGMAAGLNVPMSDVLAITAQLTLGGYSTAEAMTAVRSALTNIIRPTGQLQQQFPDLARHFTRARLEGEGLVQFLLDFQKESGGSGAAMTALFTDVQALNGVMGLLKDGGAGVAQMLSDVKNSAGAADTASKIMQGSAADTEQVLKNKLHAELVRGGSVVLPLWMEAIKGATALLKAYNDEANNTPALDLGKGVGDRGAQFAGGQMAPAAAGGMRQDMNDLWTQVGVGAVNTEKLTIDQLRGIRDAYAKEQADILGLTVEQYKKSQAMIAQLPGRPSIASESGPQAGYDFFGTLVKERERQEAAAARAAYLSSAQRVAGLQQEGAQLIKVIDSTAQAAKTYQGYGDEQQRALLEQRGALDAIAAAQSQAADATKEFNAAVAAHDEKGIAAANGKLHAALTLINDQHAVLTSAGQQLQTAAYATRSAEAQLQATVDEYTRGGEKSPVEEATAKLRTLVAEATRTHVSMAKVNAASDAIMAGATRMAEKQRRELIASVQEQYIGLAGDALAQGQAAAEKQLRTVGEQIDLSRTLSDEDKKRLHALLDQMNALMQIKSVTASIAQQMDDLSTLDTERANRNTARGLADDRAGIHLEDRTTEVASEAEMNRLLAAQAEALDTIDALEADGKTKSDAYRAAKKQLADLESRRLAILKDTDATELGHARAKIQAVQDQAKALQGVVSMTVQLAEAFGLVDSNMGGILTNIGNLVTGLGPLMTEIGNLGVMKDGTALASFSSVVSAAMPLAGAVAGLASTMFESNAPDPAIVKAQEENTRALQALTLHIGDLSKADVSGSLLKAIATAAAAYLHDAGVGAGDHPSDARLEYIRTKSLDDHSGGDWDALNRELTAAGITFADLQKLAQSLGITLTSFGDVQTLLDAIGKADTASHVDDFAGSLAALADQLRAYGITDPTEKLRRTIAVLTNAKTGIPAIGSALAGLDATSGTGATTAIAHLQQLLEDLASGKLTAADLGGATIDETRQAILDLIDEIRGDGSTGTGGYNVSTSITEASAGQLAGLLFNVSSFTERTAIAAELLARVATGGAATPLLPPALPSSQPVGSPLRPAGALDAGALSVTVESVHIHFAPGDSPSTPDGARQISDATVRAFGAALQTATRRRALANGSTQL